MEKKHTSYYIQNIIEEDTNKKIKFKINKKIFEEKVENNYEFIKKTYYENIFNVTNLEENMHFIIYSVIAFFTPFLLGHPQLLVGTIVNASLILGATYLRGYKLLPIILLPSLGVLSAGLIFGPYTMFLVYMIPFIWLSNALFAYSYKYLHFLKKNYFLSIGVPAVLKTLFLFSFASLFVSLNILPTIFLTSMGLFQLYSAILGGVLAFGIIKVREKIVKQAR